MALETERCSPNNASSPGPTDNNRRPGLDDCSDQTKEVVSSSPPPPTTMTTTSAPRQQPAEVAISAFRPVRDDADDGDENRAPKAAAEESSLLACSKPLSICSPLQNKTAAADPLHVVNRHVSPPPPLPPPLPQQPARKKPSSNAVQKTQQPAADVPRWVHQQQQHAADHGPLQPPSNAAAAVAVEYTMAMAAAAAAAAGGAGGHVPPVFPFNSWMYRFNFLPIVPAAAEYFREMQHHNLQQHHPNGAGSPEMSGDDRPTTAALRLQSPHAEFARQQQVTSLQHHLHHHHNSAVPTSQVVQSAAAHQPLQPPPPPPPPQPSLLHPPTMGTTGGYVSRPASTSGSSDVSSSYGPPTAAGVGNTKNCYRSPSPRSPSPFRLAFSVDNILRPEFGSKLHHHLQQQQHNHHLHHHHQQPLPPQHHHHHHRNGRPSSTSPPPPPPSVAKMHFNALLQNKTHSQQSIPSLHRPAPTRPKAVAVGPKRPATAVASEKVNNKRKPAQLQPLPACSPVINHNNNNYDSDNSKSANGGRNDHHHKPDDSGNEQESAGSDATGSGDQQSNDKEMWPAWVYCTRYSDRPSSGKCAKSFSFYYYNTYIVEFEFGFPICGDAVDLHAQEV